MKKRQNKHSNSKNHRMTLHETFQHKLNSLNRIGTSKEATCAELGTRFSPYIHSANTFGQYSFIAAQYAAYCTIRDTTASTVRYCYKKGYARDYVQMLIETGQSPSSIARTTSALAKLHGVGCKEIHDARPQKKYSDFTRTRHYDEAAYARDAARTDMRGFTARFLRCCGLREVELIHLHGNCLATEKDGTLTIVISRDTCYTKGKKGKTCAAKGGRPRLIRIAPEHEKTVRDFVSQAKPNELICPNVSDKLCVHGIRALFAMDCYLTAAEWNLDTIRDEYVSSQKNPYKKVPRVYRTRDGKAREFDRLALRTVAKQLGHNRENVCVESYLWHL